MSKEKYLNEKDSLFDVLTGEKDLVKLYGAAMTESSGQDVRKVVKNNLSDVAQDQFSVFEVMQKNGYYETKIADKAIIDEKIDTFSKCMQEM